MRCDWPAGFNEDLVHRPSELHVQLIINADENLSEDDNLSDDENHPDDEILPQAQILPNDNSISFNQLVPAFIAVDPEQIENFFMNFPADEATHAQSQSVSDESVMHIVSVASGNSSVSSYSYPVTHGHLSGVVPQHEEISDHAVSVLSNSVGEVPVSDTENQDELNGVELHCKETSSTLSDEDTSVDRQMSNKNNLEEEDFHEDESDGQSELEWWSSGSPSSVCFDEASSNHVEQHTNNCVMDPLSRELPNETETSKKIESLSDSIHSSTLVSQLVVVPPTDFSNEINDNLLGSDSPDHLLAELLPLDAVCSAELLDSGEDNDQDNCKEICVYEEMITFNKSNHTTTSTAECQNTDTVFLSNLTGVNSDCEVSSLSECNVLYELGFEDLGHKSNESENSIFTVQNEAYDEITTDESVLSRKRKVSSSSDEDMKNKVPRYLSDVSTDSVNVQEKVEKYCNALSCDSEEQISSDASVSDILPTDSDDNVTLTVENAVEDFAVQNRKPRSQ